MRTVREIYDVLFAFAPERMKMGDWDNVGLLCGRFTTEVETVLVALDPLPDVIAEAVELGAQCIVTHHPLFFDPPRAINETTLAGRSVLELIEHGIAAVNLHTNLDCAPGGVNDALAAKLELDNVRILNPAGEDDAGQPYGLLRLGETEQTDVCGVCEGKAGLSGAAVRRRRKTGAVCRRWRRELRQRDRRGACGGLRYVRDGGSQIPSV